MMLLLKDRRQLLNITAILALAAILLWPAYVNGQPFYMTDTSSYVRGADAAAHSLIRHSTVWTTEYFHRFSGKPIHSTSAAGEPPVVLAGRSIYYGFLLYLGQFLGNFWPVAVLQSIIVASSISVTIGVLRRRLNVNAPPTSTAAATLQVGTLLAAFTPVAYFVSFLMPDIFGALGLLAFGHLAILWQQNSRATRIFWFALLLAAMLFHTANFVLICLMSAVLAAGYLLLKIPMAKSRFAAITIAIALTLLGQALFSWSVKYATGAAPIQPPFVAARIIDDGPGYDYLREHCPEAKLIFCRVTSFKERASDSLLWSQDPQAGIFQALPPSQQRLASAEQTRFVLSVIRDRPLQALKSSFGSTIRQAGRFELEPFNYTDQTVEYLDQKLPQPFLNDAKHSEAFKGDMPVQFVKWATIAAVLLSLIVICWTIFLDLRRSGALSLESGWTLTLVIGVMLNAAICGALSTPHGRYEMRMIWLLPFAALGLTTRPRLASSNVIDPDRSRDLRRALS